MSKRGGVLEFAILGLLHESPMHGYELRKRLSGTARHAARLLVRIALPLPEAADAARAGSPSRPTRRPPPVVVAPRSSTSSRLTAKSTSRSLLAEAGPHGLGGRHLRRSAGLLRTHRRRHPHAHSGRPTRSTGGTPRQRPRAPSVVPANGSTVTPLNCSNTDLSPSNVKCDGSTN